VRLVDLSGLCRFGGARASGRVARVLGVLAIAGFLLVLAPMAEASPNFTWSGKAGQGVPMWSAAENWESKTAPASSSSIGTLSFPALTGVPCTFTTPNAGCGYGSENDVGGLSVESMSIDDGEDYSIIGEPITLGSGGLSASPTGVTSKLTISELELPIALGASQTWSIGGEGLEHLLENDLYLDGNLTGSGSALTVNMSGGPAFFVENETEVGALAIDGSNTTQAGILNGAVELFGGALNSSDGNPVSLSHIFFTGTGVLGPLTTNTAELAIGSGGRPAEGIEATSVKLDSASHIGFEISGGGVSAREDYSQLSSHGAIELGGASIEVVVRPPAGGQSCPTLLPGETYTLLSTTGALSGSFANAPEHGPEIAIRFAKACAQISQTVRISYHESGGTQTVTGTVEAAAKERQEAEAREREAKEREAREKEEALKKQLEEHAKKVAEEAAAKEATKKHEEEAVIAASKKRQEEEAAARRHQEEEAAARRHQEEEAAAKKMQEEAAVTRSVSLDGSTITVPSGGEATVKLACTGTGACAGKLTLTVKGTTKKGRKGKTQTIGTAAFSIPAGKTVTIQLKLNAAGRSLLGAGHGRLGAKLTILKSSPAPSQTHTQSVRLMERKAGGKAKR
jgi:hypothetical protein